jgi:hypothetical protein
MIACLNNLVLGSVIGKEKYRYVPTTRRYFDVIQTKPLLSSLDTRKSPVDPIFGCEREFILATIQFITPLDFQTAV